MECNILDSYGNIDINDKIIENCDYIMAGYHFASTPTSLKSMFNHCNNYMIKNEKSKNELEKTIIKNTYKKMLYETEHWIKDTYEKRYYKKLAGLCPGIIKVIMVYKDYTPWKQR